MFWTGFSCQERSTNVTLVAGPIHVGLGPHFASKISKKNHAVFRQFQGENPYFEQILGSGPPLGSNLHWTPDQNKSWIRAC